jgi:hypothetical protein
MDKKTPPVVLAAFLIRSVDEFIPTASAAGQATSPH